MAVYSDLELKGAVVTVFGGTGFIGARIVAKLLKEGARVRVATRHPQSTYFLRVLGDVGQVVAVPCFYRSETEVEAAVIGSDIVINCMGILYEKRRNDFAHVHTDLAHWIAKACAMHHVARFVHISALAADRSESEYAISKMSGERGVMQAFPAATILRPSIVFGPSDNFFNKFAALAKIVPALPLFGGGKSKFQPVYVEDVAAAVLAALKNPASVGQTYELGGPDVMTLKGVYKKVETMTGVRVHKLYIPWWMARIQAFFFNIPWWLTRVVGLSGLLPTPLLTNDQITSLQTDNVVQNGAMGFADLGIHPTSMDAVLPSYMERYLHKGKP
ncbi:MAG TPA: complex I NDUFA9 subunit family protein [Alphaproteobacteria bacterium]|nr:complex I NDUFA9 subunit family protein [Alphaproteobacteria bacterium]HNS43730.1 complex I NDUFA9 subunit family protein [Alphaproteobacteria bacterium]